MDPWKYKTSTFWMKMFWHENMNENPGYFKPPHNHPTINLFKLNWKKNWLANQSHITEISFMPPFLKSLILMESSLSLITEDRFEGSLTPFLYFRTRARVNPQLSWETWCWSRPSHQFWILLMIITIIITLKTSSSSSSSRSWESAIDLIVSQFGIIAMINIIMTTNLSVE